MRLWNEGVGKSKEVYHTKRMQRLVRKYLEYRAGWFLIAMMKGIHDDLFCRCPVCLNGER